jgi:phage terminase large subunit-like protein
MDLSALCADELHVWPQRAFWDVLSSSTGARVSPVKLVITTAGRDEDSIGAEMHRYALAVRDGVKDDPSFLPIIFAAPEEADPWDEATWYQCNPALGDFRSLEEMRAMAREAQAIPGREPAFRQLYLNQWAAQPDTAWLNIGDWDACGTTATEVAALAAGRACVVGVDLAATSDMSAVVAVFLPDEGGRVAVAAWVWWPEKACAAAMRQPGAPPYHEWVDTGHLVLTEGDVADYEAVEAKITELAAQATIRELTYDPFGAPELVQRLMKSGLTVVPTKQDAATLNPGMQELERLVVSHRIVHDRNPVLRWHVKNVRIVSNSAGAIRPDKDRRREKIDSVSAMVNALTRIHTAEPTASIYESRGLLVASGPDRDVAIRPDQQRWS